MNAAVLREVLARRKDRLPAETDAFRWLDEELPGVTVDLFGAVAIASLYRIFAPAEEQALGEGLLASGAAKSVYLKRRPREARAVANEAPEVVAPPTPLAGPPVEPFVAREAGLAFEVRPANGLSVGLYLDGRDARRWVHAEARGARVLNLFAYTCGFGLAAQRGGAARAVNVDVSRKVLDWGAVNAGHNGLAVDPRDYVSGDAFDWLGRFAKKGDRFDLVILDPPGFATTKSSRFTASRDYHRLVAATVPVLAPGARLLCLCNVEAMAWPDFEAQVSRGVSTVGGRIVQRFGASDVDFRQPSTLKCAVVTTRGG